MATTKQSSGGGKVPPRPGSRSAAGAKRSPNATQGSSTSTKGATTSGTAAPTRGGTPTAGQGTASAAHAGAPAPTAGAPAPTDAKAAVPPRPSGRTAGPSGPRPGRPTPRVSARQLAERRRRRNIYLALGSAGVVIVAVVVIIAVSLSGTTKKAVTSAGLPTGEYDIPANLVAQVEAVPVQQLVHAAIAYHNLAAPPQALPKDNKELTSGGKPEVLYIGAEYCPYCAAERWAMVMAFSKFGTFSGLHGTSSSATDVIPSTPTFAFYRSNFTSKYIAFTPVETLANDEKTTLQNPTSAQNALLSKWDPPSPSCSQGGCIPFVYIGGKYVQVGASYDSSPLSGMQFAKAVSYLTSGKNATSKAVMATAGYFLGDICALTHGQPTSVCSQVPKSLIGISTSSSSSAKSSSSKLPTAATGKK